MEEHENHDPFASWHEVVFYHRSLLADGARNEPFFKALKRTITSRSRVLDIGTGSGIWAIVAAKLGARRVTAIEGNLALVPIIRGHLKGNGVDEKVELIAGKSWETDLKDRYDIIISETIGNQGFEESIINTMIDARKRFLARGGVLIPQVVTLMAAPCFIPPDGGSLPQMPLNFKYLTDLSRNMTYRLSDRKDIQFLAKPAELLSVDLTSIKAEPDYAGMSAKWNLAELSSANAIVTWARSTLMKGIKLDTWSCLSWASVVYPFESIGSGKGKLQFELNLNNKQHHWTVKTHSGGRLVSRSYSPMFGLMKLNFDSQNGSVAAASK
jgi:ubiquinone/menaquinone biosynthesis C-methylase UbiE